MLDNDIWFLLNHGRYVMDFGFPSVEPFSVHENLSFVMQQWLSGIIFYFFYNYFGVNSLSLLLIVVNFVIIYILYKICILISDNNYKISATITVITDIFLCSYFIVTRPQIFTFILILLLIYCLESYIKTNHNKYLFILPIISLLQINFYASMWWMLYLLILPYLLDGYKFRMYSHEVYNKKNIFTAMFFMFLTALINPYGFEAIIYLFNSYGIEIINENNLEMMVLDLIIFMEKLFIFVFL